MRRDPDDLLRRIKQDEQSDDETAGRLKIFFGYAAGVGKTYAMLEAAHDAAAQGSFFVQGYSDSRDQRKNDAAEEEQLQHGRLT